MTLQNALYDVIIPILHNLITFGHEIFLLMSDWNRTPASWKSRNFPTTFQLFVAKLAWCQEAASHCTTSAVQSIVSWRQRHHLTLCSMLVDQLFTASEWITRRFVFGGHYDAVCLLFKCTSSLFKFLVPRTVEINIAVCQQCCGGWILLRFSIL